MSKMELASVNIYFMMTKYDCVFRENISSLPFLESAAVTVADVVIAVVIAGAVVAVIVVVVVVVVFFLFD